MSKLPVVSSREIIKILTKMGYYKFNQVGSHIQFKHNYRKGKVTIPSNKKEIKKGTLLSIIKQIGLTKEEFIKIYDEWL